MTYPRSPSKFTQEPELRPRSHADFYLLTSSTVVPTRKWGVFSQPVHHGYRGTGCVPHPWGAHSVRLNLCSGTLGVGVSQLRVSSRHEERRPSLGFPLCSDEYRALAGYQALS